MSAESPARFFFRHARGPELPASLEAALQRPVPACVEAPGAAELGGGDALFIGLTESWPEALLGPGLPGLDLELRLSGPSAMELLWRLIDHLALGPGPWAAFDPAGRTLASARAEPCPVCGLRTLPRRVTIERCAVCGWAHEGEGDPIDAEGERCLEATRLRFWTAVAKGELPGARPGRRALGLEDMAAAACTLLMERRLSPESRAALDAALLPLPLPLHLGLAYRMLRFDGRGPEAEGEALARALAQHPQLAWAVRSMPEANGFAMLGILAERQGHPMARLYEQRGALESVSELLFEPRRPAPLHDARLRHLDRLAYRGLFDELFGAGLIPAPASRWLCRSLDALLRSPWQRWGEVPFDEDLDRALRWVSTPEERAALSAICAQVEALGERAPEPARRAAEAVEVALFEVTHAQLM